MSLSISCSSAPSSASNTSSCACAWYVYLVLVRFHRRRLSRCRWTIRQDGGRCSRLNQRWITIGFLFVHSFVVDGVLGPTHSVGWFWLQSQHQHSLFFPLILCLTFLEYLHSLRAINHDNNYAIHEEEKRELALSGVWRGECAVILWVMR